MKELQELKDRYQAGLRYYERMLKVAETDYAVGWYTAKVLLARKMVVDLNSLIYSAERK